MQERYIPILCIYTNVQYTITTPFQKDNGEIDKNADYLNNPLLFTIPGKEDGENGYECLESSTKDYDVNEDVGPVDDLDDYENFSNTERYDDSKDGNLSR